MSTTASGGTWSTRPASRPLAAGEHTYTAVAKEESLLGTRRRKLKGRSSSTRPTIVTLNQPLSPSKNRTPTFSGSASAATEVVVHIYEGPTDEGTEISKATASGTEGTWTSGTANPALATGEHTYTAVAMQTSPLGNPRRREQNCDVHGQHRTAEGRTQQIIRGGRIQRQETDLQRDGEREHRSLWRTYTKDRRRAEPKSRSRTAGTGGAWSSGPVTPELASTGKHTYTAIATQISPLGNGEGKSKAVTFIVNDEPPDGHAERSGEAVKEPPTRVRRVLERQHRNRDPRL